MRASQFAIVRGVVIFFTALFFAFPLYWMISMAFKPENDWASFPPPLIPAASDARELLVGAFRDGGLQGLRDSFIIATVNMLISLLIGGLAGLGLSRYGGGRNIAFFILSQRFAPPITFALAFFSMFAVLQVLDTHLAVIIAHLTFNIPFAT